MAAINSLLSQELQAKCRWQKDGTTMEFTTTLPQGPTQEKKSMDSILHKKIERVIKTTHISNSDLPDTSAYVVPGYSLEMSQEECGSESFEYTSFDFRTFTSTWLSVTAKDVNLADYIDFDAVVKHDYREPECMMDSVSNVKSFDHIPGVAHRHDLQYTPELGLKEVLQKLGGDVESVNIAGARIANALEDQPTSWVLANMAALYWRVEGNAGRAVDCLRLALSHAHREVKDTSLISLANILHQAGHLNDAIVVTAAALDVTNKLPVSHFTLANLYAAKEQWPKAVQFYESTLALQSTFQPAKDRLKAILCQGHLNKANSAASSSP